MKIKVNGEEKIFELNQKNPLLSKTLESMGILPKSMKPLKPFTNRKK